MNQAALRRIFSEAFMLSAEGRTSRKMFWLAQVVYMVIYFAVIAVTFPFGQFGQMVSLAVSLVILVFSWLLMIRRLHDITRSGWWSLLLFIPVVGFIALIYFGCAQSSFGANRWGVMPIE
jgi:uncharacterized membrane protein YhaH (DUF805 family)